ncbi:MAG: family 10 glycosylhydrolase [Chloroflexota bacterium]|nr:family 10 glycosylhydrolase [Chloroflexota bacterium]
MGTNRFPTMNPSPRGQRRMIYVSDPGSIAIMHLPDPVTEEDLRSWINQLADSGMDTFVQEIFHQGWTTYWRSAHFEYDPREYYSRFDVLLDAGIQPIEVLIDQCHRRNMEFVAGIRVNDNHGHISIAQGFGSGSTFITENPQWHIQESDGDVGKKISTVMDFSHRQVRDYVSSVAFHLLDGFDVDGIELAFRDKAYFVESTERSNEPLMTEFIKSVSDTVAKFSKSKRRSDLILGVRVYPTLELCHELGLDVETWITGELIDYVAPSDTMYTSINESIEEFSSLTSRTRCLLYPAIMPHSSARRIRFLDSQPLNLEQNRAAAQNFYCAGADGLSIFNHMWAIEWAPFYPMALYELNELRDPEKVNAGMKHYLFEPMTAGQAMYDAGYTSKGRSKDQRIVLSASESCPTGKFRFRFCENSDNVKYSSLLFRAYNMSGIDEVEVVLNGKAINPSDLKRRGPKRLVNDIQKGWYVDYEKRIDLKSGVDKSSHSTLGLSPIPYIPETFVTFWFELNADLVTFGDNFLEVLLLSGDNLRDKDIIIDEIEIKVIPEIP